MAPNSLASTAFLLSFTLIFFSLVSSVLVPSTGAPCLPTAPTVPCHSQPAVPACPREALKLGTSHVCEPAEHGPVHLVVGTPPRTPPCCSLLSGLADLEAAACLCTAIKANVLGLDLDIPMFSLLLNYCGKQVPYGFECA